MVGVKIKIWGIKFQAEAGGITSKVVDSRMRRMRRSIKVILIIKSIKQNVVPLVWAAVEKPVNIKPTE